MKYKVVKVINSTGVSIECDYPRGDKNKVIGDTIHTYYFIKEIKKPTYDKNKSFLVQNEDELVLGATYKTNVCNRSWSVEDYPNEVIIQRLNDSLGSHLDFNYPIPIRIKHIREKDKSITNQARKDYIESLQNWEDSCRTECDDREQQFIDNNISPSFEWESKPE